jgi:hypothetical protein
MKRSTPALMALLAAVLTLALTSPTNVAWAGKPQDGCVTVAAAVDPDAATFGDLVTGTATVANCGPRKDRVTVELTLDGPGGLGMVLGQTSMRLNPGEERSTSVTIEVPPEALPGTYTATAEASSKRGGYATDSVTVEIY